MFGNSLVNLRKSTGECKNKHSDKFLTFLKIFGKNRKMFQSAQNDLPASFEFFFKSSENFGNCHKVLKNNLPAFFIFYFFLNLWKLPKSSAIFGIIRKKSENVGKFSK